MPTKEYGYRNGELLIVAEAPTSYELVARHSGRCADVVNMWTHNGAPLVQYDCWGGANQHFRIEPVGGGYYRIVAEHSNKGLEIENWSQQGGARVIQWEYVGGANQQWSIEATDSGYVRLIARHSGQVMEIAGGPGATQNGAELIQWGWWGGSSQQWKLRGVGNSNTVKWLVNDHLGTPRMIADGTGSLAGITRKDYLPFGEELSTQGGRTAAQGYRSDNTRQGFTGYEHDAETGLEFAQARYFASVQGRFTSVDPLMASGKTVVPQSWNRYTYCLNSPLILVDPSGMQWGYHYLNKEHTQIGISWFDGKVKGKGWHAVQFDKSGVRSFTLTDGTIATLSAGSKVFQTYTPSRMTTSGEGVQNAAAGAFDGFVPGGAQARRFLGLNVDENSLEYRNTSAIGTGVAIGSAFVMPVGGLRAAGRAGDVALDANALIPLLEGSSAEAAAVTSAMAGRAPSVSITAAKEFLRGGGDVNLLRQFLQETGGGIAPAASSSTIQGLTGIGVKAADARVVGSAIDRGIPLLTRDRSLLNKVPGTAIGF